VQINQIVCLDLVIPNFKSEAFLGVKIINKKSNNCVLGNELDVINVQQNLQQQQ